jgi:hypothetical protein
MILIYQMNIILIRTKLLLNEKLYNSFNILFCTSSLSALAPHYFIFESLNFRKNLTSFVLIFEILGDLI